MGGRVFVKSTLRSKPRRSHLARQATFHRFKSSKSPSLQSHIRSVFAIQRLAIQRLFETRDDNILGCVCVYALERRDQNQTRIRHPNQTQKSKSFCKFPTSSPPQKKTKRIGAIY